MLACNHSAGPAPPAAGPSRRRSDAGVVRFTARDIRGLSLAGDMYGAPYDPLETALTSRPPGCAGLPAGGAPPG